MKGNKYGCQMKNICKKDLKHHGYFQKQIHLASKEYLSGHYIYIPHIILGNMPYSQGVHIILCHEKEK